MKSTWSLPGYSCRSSLRMGAINWHGTQVTEPSSSSLGTPAAVSAEASPDAAGPSA